MKIRILIITTLILSSFASAQPKEKIDPTYFILGTLSDYNGRFSLIKKTNQVDRYESYEESLKDEVNSISRRDLKMIAGTTIDYGSTTFRYETFSKELSLKLNSFYNKNSIINESLFKDSIQMYSYLLGRYYRYGARLSENIYVLRFLNSPNHYLCRNFFQITGCKFYYKEVKAMPAQNIYYFTPNQHLKKLIDSISEQEAAFDNEYKEYFMKFWEMTDEQYSKNKKDLQDKELSDILPKFK